MIRIHFTVLMKQLHSRYNFFANFLFLKTLSFYVSLISFHQLHHSFLKNLGKDSNNWLIVRIWDFQISLFQNLCSLNFFFSKMEFRNYHYLNLSFFIGYLYLKLFFSNPNCIHTHFTSLSDCNLVYLLLQIILEVIYFYWFNYSFKKNTSSLSFLCIQLILLTFVKA